MSRGASTDFKNAAAAGNVVPAILAYFDFSGGEVRFWSGIGDLVWDGDTYVGLGELAAVSPVSESAEVRANSLDFTLSGMPSSIVTKILAEGYRGRSCKMWLALFASPSSTTVIADPLLLFSGRMDQCRLNDTGETASVTVTAESRLIDLQRPRERRLTDEDQKSLFAGDRGLEFVAGLQDKEIPWGATSSSATAATSSQSAVIASGRAGYLP